MTDIEKKLDTIIKNQEELLEPLFSDKTMVILFIICIPFLIYVFLK